MPPRKTDNEMELAVRTVAGTNAQRNGAIFEKIVESVSSIHNYEVVKFKDYKRDYSKYCSKRKLLIVHPRYVDYFKRERRGTQDFLITVKKPNETYQFPESSFSKDLNGNNILEICIQCKCQRVQGSIDEKLGLFALNLENKKIEQKNIILLHCGTGIRQDFLDQMDTLSTKLANEKSYNLKIMNVNEFNEMLGKIG